MCRLLFSATLSSFALGPLGTNSYLVDNGTDALAIDVGGDPAPMLDFLQTNGLTLRAILVTHRHFDHLYGVSALQKATQAPAYVPAGEEAIARTEASRGGIWGMPLVPDFSESLSRKAADIIAAQILIKPDCVLGLATGSTPVGAYKELIQKYENGDLDFSQVSSVNLDEYKGLSGDNDQSYRYFMNHNLFDHVNIDKSRTHVPNGLEPDADKACSEYNALIRSMGGIDLQLLGIGGNGHIGFNEPCEEFICDTHCVSLAQSTIEANARFFSSIDEVPKYAYTMGIANIMSANKVLLLASGKAKAQAVLDSCFGPVTPHVPASVLQLHRDAVIIADSDALSLAKEKGLF